MPYQTRYKQKLLETFDYVIQFLNAHNLRWFCCYGTLIGAIRHKGLIPWDDDIDICMPKEDYDRLRLIKDEMEKDHYRFLSLADNGYYCAHSKVIDSDTTIWEREHYPFMSGVFVDIFPLYFIDSCQDIEKTIKDYQALYLECRRTIKKIPFKTFLKSLFVDHDRVWREFIKNRISYPSYKHEYFLNRFLNFEKQLNQENGEYAICLSLLAYGAKEIMKASYFSDYIEMPFEGLNVRVPIGYHEYLTQLYGDYMTPPPVEKRESKHDMLYVNLNEGLSISEVKKRMKKGETKVF